MNKKVIIPITLIMVVSFSAESPGLDWPHFRGPNRDGVSTESGLLNHWPKEGPRLLWSAEALGIGHSSVAVSKGTIYVTGMNDENEGVLTAFDLVGKEKWKKTYGPEWTGGHKGVRCTPTVTDGYVYIRTGVGRVVCLDAGSGELKWEVNDKLRFEGEYSGGWGYSDSILIDGDIVICSPGGPDATLVALDKSTGKTVWTSNGLSDSAAYCAPILIARGDSRQIVTVLKTSVVGLDPANGKTLWKQNYQGGRNISPNSPLYADGEIYITSGYDHGGLKVRLSEDGKQATRLWEDETLDTHHGGVVLVSGYIYGSNWLNNPKGQWVCLDWKTGKPQYETAWEGNKGSIITADGMLYCYGEDGIVALVKPDPKEFKIVSSFEITQGSDNHWAHPAISDARLYIRHGDALMVYDIKPPS